MNFWDSQSVLSGDGDLSSLSLVRWRREVEWSPWNCLLVNEEEKEIHADVDDLAAVGDIPALHIQAFYVSNFPYF